MIVISEQFFDKPEYFEGLWFEASQDENSIQPLDSLTAQEDFVDVVDPGWAEDYSIWMDLYKIGMSYKQHIFDNYDVDPDKFHDWWGKIHEDTWDRENYPNLPRENSDIHIDIFPEYTKVINLQIYMSKDIPPEAGTCFWKHTGEDLLLDTLDSKGEIASFPYTNWQLAEQLPFEYNTAFSYDAGPNGEFHSSPLTNDLLDLGVPNHNRRVIIMRYRFK